MPLEPRDRFGRYEIAELLGHGGMGEVYRAVDTLLHRNVALKVLRAPEAGKNASENASNPSEGAARILREARAAAGIEHPNAISIYDMGEVDGVPFLAMEFIAGNTLRAYVGDESVPLDRRVSWLVDVARALAAAHARGLVHRDIKPENVMVRHDGVVKVLDFGIARYAKTTADPSALTAPANAPATMTGDGVVVGTPLYMSPEQMRGERLDGRSDQFAWGVLAYELVTGHVPWTGANGVQLVAQILSLAVDPPRTRNAALAPEVDAVIVRALAKGAAERFESMDVIAEALEPFAGVRARSLRATAGRSSGLPPDVAHAATERATPAASSGVARDAASTRMQMSTERPAQTAPSRASPRRTRAVFAALAVLVLGGVGYAAFRRGADPATAPSASQAAPPPAPPSASVEASLMSQVPEATAAYRAGVQALHDGSFDAATLRFDRAVSLDANFAAAHLRRALLTFEFDSEMREHVQSAQRHRASLRGHDLALLDAIELLTHVPPDLKGCERRLEEAVTRYPGDAELSFFLGLTRHQITDFAAATAAFDDTLRKEPGFASALFMKAREQVFADDLRGARETYARCLATFPGATGCLDDLNMLQMNDGQCDQAVDSARRLITIEPDSLSSYRRLAGALLGIGQPSEAALAALTQGWERAKPEQRRRAELRDGAMLKILAGEFDRAEESLIELERVSAADPDAGAHYVPAQLLVRLNLETGRNARAISLGNEYLRRRSAWLQDDFDYELSIQLYALQYRAGGLSRTEFSDLRAKWLRLDEGRRARIGQLATEPGRLWTLAYAYPADTHEDAVDALRVEPAERPLLDAISRWALLDGAIGRTYQLAGQFEMAKESLGHAARSCSALVHPFDHLWAQFRLGETLEALRDTDGACRAYAAVLARWGNARPRSTTADKTRARMRALAC